MKYYAPHPFPSPLGGEGKGEGAEGRKLNEHHRLYKKGSGNS